MAHLLPAHSNGCANGIIKNSQVMRAGKINVGKLVWYSGPSLPANAGILGEFQVTAIDHYPF